MAFFSLRKSTYAKLLLSFILLNILNIFLVFGLYYWNADRIMKGELDELSHRMLAQTQNVSNYLYTSIIKDGYDLYDDKSVYAAMFSDDPVDVFEQHLLFTRLNRYIQSNPIVRSIYLYNRQLNIVVSTAYPNMTIDSFPDKEITAVLQEYRYRSPKIPYFLRHDMPGLPPGNPTLSLLMSEPASGSDRFQGAMVINIDNVQLHDLLAHMADNPVNQLYILQDDGEFITAPDSALFSDSRSRFRYYDDIERGGRTSGTMVRTADGQKYVIAYQKTNLESTGFVYIGIYPYTALFKSLIHIRNITLLSSGTLIAASLLLSILLSRRIYFPIRSLTQFARKHIRGAHHTAGEDDLETISRAFAKVIENNESLERLSFRSRRLLREQFLRGLLLGYEESRSGSFNARIAEHGMKPRSDSRILVFLLRVDQYRRFEAAYDAESRFLIRYAMGNIAGETLAEQRRPIPVDIGADHVAVIVEAPADRDDELMQELEAVQRNIREYLKLSVTVGVGDAVETLAEAAYAYESALAATQGRLFHGPGRLFVGGKNEQAGRSEYAADKEKAIVDVIRLGKPHKLTEAVRQMLGSMDSQGGADFFAGAAQAMLNVLKAVQGLPGRAFDRPAMRYDEIYAHLTAMESCEEIAAWMADRLAEAAEPKEEDRKSKNAGMIEKGLKFIEERYRSTDFSVTDVAEHLGYSVSYVNKLFNEHLGTTVHETINRKRLAKARELVEQSDMIIGDIAEMAGFSSSNYFYYVFKKEFGMTPLACRKWTGTSPESS
ncbi:AraC family transcriptional regulator [Cohnella nanjingensis]|nr:AraC family transcriptional regulator [Cohnella nanjingensis]